MEKEATSLFNIRLVILTVDFMIKFETIVNKRANPSGVHTKNKLNILKIETLIKL